MKDEFWRCEPRKAAVVLLSVLAYVFMNVCEANAALIDNLDGTVTQIRNDGSVLMWLKDARYAHTSGYSTDQMLYAEAVTWADSLVYAGYDDWRLPSTLPANGISYNFDISYDGSTDAGYNITSPSGEMSYMYYVELGNLGYYDILGNEAQPGWGLNNTGPFINLLSAQYWSGSLAPTSLPDAWFLDFDIGQQYVINQFFGHESWAVRDINVVPEPATMLLFGLGGIATALIKKRRKA